MRYIMDKSISELSYWRGRYQDENQNFINSHYKDLMLSILNIDTISIFDNKVVADFGCGPRGSLEWINNASECIGIDVLANEYIKIFDKSTAKHNMLYVNSTEDYIPLKDNSIDILFTINSLDHVNNLEKMTQEILRILKKNGIFGGSFNLFEESSSCEPQTLNPKIIKECLIDYLKDVKIRYAIKSNPTYENFKNKNYLDLSFNDILDFPVIMWVSGIKS